MGGLTAAGGVGALEGLDYLREGHMPSLGTVGGIALGGVLAPKYLLQPLMNNPAAVSYLSRGLSPGLARTTLELPNKSILANALLRRALPQLVANPSEQPALAGPLGQ